VFHISICGDSNFVWGLIPPKLPRGDGTDIYFFTVIILGREKVSEPHEWLICFQPSLASR